MKVRTILTLATVAMVVAGCAKVTADPGSGTPPPGIAHATGAGDVLIQISDEGGFVAPSYSLTRLPQFSLFGDGSVYTGGVSDAIYPGAALPPINVHVVAEAGIQAILRAGIDAGLEDGQDHTDLGSIGIADATTMVFTFDADGVSHTVKVYALGMLSERPAGMTAEEFHARRALQDFLEALGTLETWLPAGSVGPTAPFEGTGARLYVDVYRPDPELTEPAQAWPLDTALRSFGAPSDVTGIRCGVVSGPDWTDTVLPMAKGANALTPWTSEGRPFSISFRPLMPNEATC